MRIADRDRLVAINKKIEWFVDNQYDIRLDVVGPLLFVLHNLLERVYAQKVCDENDMAKLEHILSKAEKTIMPDDAYLFKYDPYYKLWD